MKQVTILCFIILIISSLAGMEVGCKQSAPVLPSPSTSELPTTARIAFSSDRDGNDEIYVMDVDGSNETRLTNNPGDDFAPTWSPDGKRIAFVTLGRDVDGIYVMDADGSNQICLTPGPSDESYPAWSP